MRLTLAPAPTPEAIPLTACAAASRPS